MGLGDLARGLQRPTRPDPVPLETGRLVAVVAGTGLWAVAFLVLLGARLLGSDPPGWWIGMCAYGVVLGLLGVRAVNRLGPRR